MIRHIVVSRFEFSIINSREFNFNFMELILFFRAPQRTDIAKAASSQDMEESTFSSFYSSILHTDDSSGSEKGPEVTIHEISNLKSYYVLMQNKSKRIHNGTTN